MVLYSYDVTVNDFELPRICINKKIITHILSLLHTNTKSNTDAYIRTKAIV